MQSGFLLFNHAVHVVAIVVSTVNRLIQALVGKIEKSSVELDWFLTKKPHIDQQFLEVFSLIDPVAFISGVHQIV